MEARGGDRRARRLAASATRPAPRFGLALHIGELLYGNIGAADRLDFTCIGPAVNLAARLEGLASRLGRTTLLSAEFAGHCGAEVEPLGVFALAGFRGKVPVYGLAGESVVTLLRRRPKRLAAHGSAGW